MIQAASLPSSSRPFVTLDGIRGVASLVIVLAHTWMLFGVRYEGTYLAVDLFFMLSGVVVANAYQTRLETTMSVPRFFWIRLVRIYPLYLIGVALMVLTILLGVSDRITWVDRSQFTVILGCALFLLPYLGSGSYLITPLNPPGWSLVFELAINAVYGVIARWLGNRLLIAIIAASGAGLIAIVFLRGEHSIDVGWHPKTFIGGFFRVTFPFFVGVLLQRLHLARLARAGGHALGQRAARILPWLLLVAVVAITTNAPAVGLRPYYDLLVVMVVFPVLVYTAMQVEPGGISARVFHTLGVLSYAIYAIHYPLAYLLIGLWETNTGTKVESFEPWDGFTLIIILLPLCWWLVRRFDEPLRRRLLKAFQGARAVPVVASAAVPGSYVDSTVEPRRE